MSERSLFVASFSFGFGGTNGAVSLRMDVIEAMADLNWLCLIDTLCSGKDHRSLKSSYLTNRLNPKSFKWEIFIE